MAALKLRKPSLGAKGAANRLQAAEDLRDACELRKQGWHIRQIAKHLGRSIGWVSQEINRALQEIPAEAVEHLRAHIVAREEAIIAEHWSNRMDPDSAKVIQDSDKILIGVLGCAAPKPDAGPPALPTPPTIQIVLAPEAKDESADQPVEVPRADGGVEGPTAG